ncbi:uncharacterized protein DUF4369 [Gelidibacter algens]|uniref:Uncharacterized protein DUF4369 n=1 Tax=Gelidibacter algens TaxID=49280 RepID=A0A1A7R3Y3_9FLAO|nr:DUF4369 domain-containing protein [Gelidibacter algens]OBX26970.1 hypothetical protein A9996_01945 [Gelidibacter algens]RAJ19935.1 uncharacterized protein DUF4369 [Gelidibacter algens]
MKRFAFIISLLIVSSCAKDNSNFTLKGSIKDLKKGTVYLQKIDDTLLISIDSLIINGESQFELHTYLEGPEVLYLKLDKNGQDSGIIPFFADKGVTEINTTLKNFFMDAKIKGSVQHDKLEEYQMMMSKFKDKNLDLIKNNLEAQRSQDSILMASSLKEYNNLIIRKYLYTINFAINNKDSEVAPYLAVSEIPDANLRYLDTINNALTPEIKSSKYGKALQDLIAQRKKQ